MTSRRLALICVVPAIGSLAVASAAAPAGTSSAAPKKITAAGAGQVKLGMTHSSLRRQGLVGRLRAGCELGGPNTRSARLRAPLSGSVDYTQTTPRRVQSIAIRGGAEARGVGIGATIPEIRDAFSRVTVDHRTEDVFNITLVRIRGSSGDRFQFAVDVDTDKTILIGIPFIAFCE